MKKTQDKQKRLGNKGFSLVELIVVIAIMAVLVGIMAPILINNIGKSRESKDITTLETVYTAISTAYADEQGNKDFEDTYNTGEVISLSTILADSDKFSTLVKEYSGMTAVPTLTGTVYIGSATGTESDASGNDIKFIIKDGKVTVALTDAVDGATTITDDNTYYGDKGDKPYSTSK